MDYLQMRMSGEQLTEIINNLYAITTELKFKTTKEGIAFVVVDTPNVALVDMYLSRAYFQEYIYSYEAEEIDFALYIKDMKKMVLPVKKTDRVIVHLSAKDQITYCEITINEGIKYIFESDEHDTYRRIPKKPEIDLKNNVEIEAKDLYDAVNRSARIGEKMYIGIDAERNLYTKTNEHKNNVVVDLSYESICDLEECRSLYAIYYLMSISKALKGYRKIDLSFSKENPVKITKSFIGQDENSYVTYLLAPRVEVD